MTHILVERIDKDINNTLQGKYIVCLTLLILSAIVLLNLLTNELV